MSRIPSTLLAAHDTPIELLRRRVARWMMRAAFGRGRLASVAHPLPTRGIHRILVCHISHTLGNTLLLTPLLRELERVYPGAEVDVVSRSPVADDLFGKFRDVRHIHRLPRHGFAAPWRLVRCVRELRARRYDLAIDPCIRSQSNRIGILAARAGRTLGFAGAGKTGELTHAVEAPPSIFHVGKLPVHLLRSAMGLGEARAFPALDIGLTDEERLHGRKKLAALLAEPASASSPVVALFCNATGSKYLGSDWWQHFAVQLRTRWPHCRIVEIVAAAGGSLLDDAYPTYYSSDVRRLARVLSAADMFVSADCGVMHLACATGVRTIGLFATTDPVQWGPYGSRDAVIDISSLTPEQASDAMPSPDRLAATPGDVTQAQPESR